MDWLASPSFAIAMHRALAQVSTPSSLCLGHDTVPVPHLAIFFKTPGVTDLGVCEVAGDMVVAQSQQG